MISLVKKDNEKIVSKYGNTKIVQTKDYITLKVKQKKKKSKCLIFEYEFTII